MSTFIGTKSKKAEIKKDNIFRILHTSYFLDLIEGIYKAFNGSQTIDILKRTGIRLIDSITIDSYIHHALGIEGLFLDSLMKNEKRIEAYKKRIDEGNQMKSSFDNTLSREKKLASMTDIFFMYPDGSQEKSYMMESILQEFFRRSIDEIERFFFSKGEFDYHFYELFGVKKYSRTDHEWMDSIDGISIDTYVYDVFKRVLLVRKTFKDYVDIDSTRSTIYNLRSKRASTLISKSVNFNGQEKLDYLVNAVLMAPRWSPQKDTAVVHLIKHYFIMNKISLE